MIHENVDMNDLEERFLPIWDARKGAITSYLYCPEKLVSGGTIIPSFNLFSKRMDAHDVFNEDLASIRAVKKELHTMAAAGRRLFILCPVHYRTLKIEHHFLSFVGECRKIPEAQRQYLIFVLLDLPDNVAQIEIERCVRELKKYSRRIYGHTEISIDIDFRLFKDPGIESIGLCLDTETDEKQLMDMMDFYSRKAAQCGFRELFALNLSSLSLTTSAICSGYTYLGGKAIHGFVKNPDHVYRFENEHLFKGLLKRGDAAES